MTRKQQDFEIWMRGMTAIWTVDTLREIIDVLIHVLSAKTGENVEDAFLETAKKIYQNIQDGSLDLNAAESGVQV